MGRVKQAGAPAQSLGHARRVLAIESAAIDAVSNRLDEAFVQAVDLMAASQGKIVVTGMGKSGHICRKIAATLASTGTPSFFLHSAEALHGDLGMLARQDLVLAISNSGETREVIDLLPATKRLGVPLVVLTGDPGSTLGRAADVVLDVSVAEEACPMGLAPTASTTVTLALGDALAVVLLQQRGFRSEDFATLHPAGALGRKLLRVADLMHVGAAVPTVALDAPMRDVLSAIGSKGLGTTCVVDAGGALAGVVTDGDVRRALADAEDTLARTAASVMNAAPKTIPGDALAATAVALMERHAITSLVIVDDAKRPLGLIHLHDLLRAGVV